MHVDAKCQTSKKLSHGTPRKAKLRKVIDGQRKRLKRMREALNMKQKRKPILQKEAMTILRQFLPDNITKFIELQIDLHQKKPKGRRYTKETKRFALSLYHISGGAYRMVAKFFSLPSKSSLLKWVSGLPRSPGLIKEAMDAVESKVKLMCTISMDEMSLKVNLAYDSSKDEVIENYLKQLTKPLQLG